MTNRTKAFVYLALGFFMLGLTLAYAYQAFADEKDTHVIHTNILVASPMYNNITYSQDANECFVWKYSDEESHWHVLSVDNPQVVSTYIEADDDDESRHLILSCFGPTTTLDWKLEDTFLDGK